MDWLAVVMKILAALPGIIKALQDLFKNTAKSMAEDPSGDAAADARRLIEEAIRHTKPRMVFRRAALRKALDFVPAVVANEGDADPEDLKEFRALQSAAAKER